MTKKKSITQGLKIATSKLKKLSTEDIETSIKLCHKIKDAWSASLIEDIGLKFPEGTGIAKTATDWSTQYMDTPNQTLSRYLDKAQAAASLLQRRLKEELNSRAEAQAE